MRRDLRFCCVSTYVLMADELSAGHGRGQLSLTPQRTSMSPWTAASLSFWVFLAKKNHTKVEIR